MVNVYCRFSEISGKLNSRKFMESYKFLEGYQEKEVELLSQQMSKVKKDDEKEAIKAELIKSRQEMKERQRDQAVKKRLSELKKIERQKVAQGKKPFFLKESVKKDIALEERYDELKKEGKLQKFLVKKRKKNANKDHRWLPYERREN